MTHLVFVYGTLKSGHGNNRLLRSATFLGPAWTQRNEFLLWDNGGFPFASKAGPYVRPNTSPQHGIKGELYKIDDETLQDLDRLEGHPRWYRRELVPVYYTHPDKTLDAEGEQTAWIYLIPRQPSLPLCPVVDGCYEWRRRS